LSWDALASWSAADFWETATGFDAAFEATGSGAATGAATAATGAGPYLCLAKTLAIIEETLAEPVDAVVATEV
jgi:hypothetical protein